MRGLLRVVKTHRSNWTLRNGVRVGVLRHGIFSDPTREIKMRWSPQQDKALKAVHDWLYNSDQQVFRLFGYAGTGKTTLARHFAEGISGLVAFAAFTGKAAHVLRLKGCEGAMTIHQLIYITRDKSKRDLRNAEEQLTILKQELKIDGFSVEEIQKDERIIRLTKLVHELTEEQSDLFFQINHDSIVPKCKLVVIDEVSMVDQRIGEDLLSFGTKVLVLGDPAQLPPIKGNGFFTENVQPDIMLTDIHRQAAESPIIRMATMVRNQTDLHTGDYGDGCRVVTYGQIEPYEALNYDQILVGKNKTRHSINNRVRMLHGYEDPLPVMQDKLVCLRNNHEVGLLNGAIYTVVSNSGVLDEKVAMSIIPEDDDFSLTVLAHQHHFLGQGDDLKWFEKKEAEEFDYGYALTVHKAQGSQYDNLLLFDESYCFRADKWKHLYTGITRAAEGITVVK